MGLTFGVGPGASAAVAQARPTEGAAVAKPSEAERNRRLQERDRHRSESVRLANSGRLDDAVREAEAALVIDRETRGELSEGVAESLGLLAQVHEARENWTAARTSLRDLLALRQRQPDSREWRVGDARRALADLDRRLVMTPEHRQRLQAARQLYRASNRLMARGQYTAAEAPLREAIQIRKSLLGEDHPDFVTSLNNLGMLHRAMGDYARAEPTLCQALEIWRKAVGDGHPHYALGLNNLGLLYQDMGGYVRAEPLLHQALEILRTAVGEHHPDYASSLSNLGIQYHAIGDYARAETTLRRAVEIRKEAVGERHPDYATSLNNLGSLYQAMGDYARAEPLLRRVLEIQKEVVGEHHPDYARGLHNLGSLYGYMGDYARAGPLLRQALEIAKEAVGDRHPDYATSLNNLGELYQAAGDYARAEPLYRQAVEIMKEAVGDRHPDYAAGLSSLGALYQAMGDYARAEPLLRQALEIRRKAVGGHHPNYAQSLNNLGSLYVAMGDFVRAEPALRQAMEIWKKAVGEGHPDYASGLNNLGLLYQDMGDYSRAEPALRHAVEIKKNAFGEGHPDYATSLNNLGSLYQAMGDYARAEPLLHQALEIRKEAVREGHPDYATSLNNLGSLYQAMGNYARAEPLYRQALEIQKKAVGEGHPDYAQGLINVGSLYRAMGDYARAEPLYRQALEIQKKAVGEGHPVYAQALNHLALLYHAMGDSIRAEPLVRESLDRQTTHIYDTASAVGERPIREWLGSLSSSLDAYLSIAQRTGAIPEVLYRRTLDWKGVSVARQADDRLVRDRPELRPALDELASVRARLAHLAFTAPAPAQRDVWRMQLGALRERKEDLEAELARGSATYRAGKQASRVGPEEVAGYLPAGTALVDMIVYTHLSPPPRGKGPCQGELRLLAFVARRDRPVVRVELGEEKPIADAVFTWRRALETHQLEALHQSAAALGRLVWEPIRPRLGDTRTILVAPDGPLSYFPLAALPGREPGSYLIEDVAIGYLGSGREAVSLLTAPETRATGRLLAAVAVGFQADPGRAGSAPTGHPSLLAATERSGFRPLPGTKAEGELARDLFHRAFPDRPAVLLTGAEPTEAEVKKRLDGGHWRAVHLGTHGFFESPARVAALRGAVRRDQPFAFAPRPGKADEHAADFALTPFLRSGVVLAGGGRSPDLSQSDPLRNAPPSEDGILTAEEVQSLDLRGTELAVLSACETGLGQGYYRQGVLGLQRAFHAAGARAVVASLWKVDDAATCVLMEQFYTNVWVKKMPKLEALRRAQLAVLNDPGLVRARWAELVKRGILPKPERGIKDVPETLPGGGKAAPTSPRDARSDPSLWAAFVLSGDGR
jgi:tetratricopeptide (TPR) repeat protein